MMLALKTKKKKFWKKCSQDRVESYLNIGLVTSMAFSLCCRPKPKYSIGCTPIFKRLFLHAHVGHFL